MSPIHQLCPNGGEMTQKCPFNIVSFKEGQKGRDWLEWRRMGVGASDISVLMGTNPYQTPKELWDIKCGFQSEEKVNFAMQRGIDAEPKARKWVEKNLDLNLKPVCIVHPKNAHFKASLDGFDFEKRVLVEIKSPSSKKIQELAFKHHRVPDYWLHQVQWQAFLCEPTETYIAVWNFDKKECEVITIFPSRRIQERMVEVANKFWKNVQFGKPPSLTEKDIIQLKDSDLDRLLEDFEYHAFKKTHAANECLKIKEKILPYIKEGKRFKTTRFNINKVAIPKRYDYGKMQTDGIDIDKYLKPLKNTFSVRITKQSDM